MTLEKPRWTFAKNTAIKLIAEKSVRFPVDLIHLIDQLPKIALKSYDTMVADLCSHGMQVDLDWVQENLADGSQDAALVKMSNCDDLIILYNNDTLVNIPQRIRFSIAHEIGHYMLNHPFITSISRDGELPSSLTEKEYLTYEAEAQAFAQCLLIPTPSLDETDTLKDIQVKYDVSNDAASHAYKEYHDRRPWGWPTLNISNYCFESPRVYAVPPTIGFHLTVGGDPRIYCYDCQELSRGNDFKNINFCPVCDSRHIYVFNQFDSFTFHERFGDKVLKYSCIPVDNKSKVGICPVCQNEELNGDFCEICGTYLINRCTGRILNGPFNPFNQIDASEIPSFKGCGTLLQGNARFCNKCGSISTFYIQQLLDDWHDEKQFIQAEQAIERTNVHAR